MEKRIIKLATIGSGTIVEHFLDGVQITEGIVCEAVYSRSQQKADALANRYGAAKRYTDLQEMLQDEEVNFVYVASPNSLHYEQTRAALLHGKNVICEKPFTTTAEKARELVTLAGERGLYLFDAVPPSFLPNFAAVKENLQKIGRIRLVMTNFSQYSSRYDALLAGEITNVFSKDFAGGCLQDINFYNLYFNAAMFGQPKWVKYHPNMYPGQVDTSGVLMMGYEDFVSTNVGAKDSWGVNYVQIQGEKGYIYVTDGNSKMSRVQVVTREESLDFTLQSEEQRWNYEVRGIVDIVSRGDMAECNRRLELTVQVIALLEQARKEAGIWFAGEEGADGRQM